MGERMTKDDYFYCSICGCHFKNVGEKLYHDKQEHPEPEKEALK